MLFRFGTRVIKIVECSITNATPNKYYSRWSHRQPAKVWSPEQFEDMEQKFNNSYSKKDEDSLIHETRNDLPRGNTNVKWRHQQDKHALVDVAELDSKSEHYMKPRVQSLRKPKKQPPSKKIATDMLKTVIGTDGSFIYSKLKDNDPIISTLMIPAKSQKSQSKREIAILEGKRLIKEALESGCKLQNLLFSRVSDVEYLKPHLPKTGAKIYKMPYREIQMWSDLTTSPGVIGIFKVPDVESYIPPLGSLPLTVICDNVREPGNLGAILRTAVGAGAEKIVLTKGCVDLWDTKVLRSACGSHFRGQIHTKKDSSSIRNLIQPGSKIFIADNKIVSESDDYTQHGDSHVDFKSIEEIVEAVPLLPYYSVNFEKLNSIVLVVGGETEGISEDSFRLAAEFNGVRINVPLNNNIESLNTGTALGVIVFEIKRQMALAGKDFT